MRSIRQNLQFILGAAVVIATLIGVSFFVRPQASGGLKVYFFDVGQGDASYIKMPGGEDVLIDGGPDNKVLDELGKVMDFGDREINLVILSHPHADHLTGLLEVLKRYKVDEVWETGVEYSSQTYDSWQKEISAQKIPDKIVKAGDEKNFGEAKIVVLYPLSPLENLPAGRQVKRIDNLNNASIINRLDYQKFSVLFLGDAETEVQKKIAPQMRMATVLKTGHHGSRNGTTEEILAVVRPALAIISAGAKNTYGHPHAEALNLLKSYAVRIFRTDQNGTIEVDSDGEGYSVKTFR
ncbi:MAG TPA: ComEC/Rec2 family competence protein [Patescibacteria group bacterium]|nr:ComEC/Rec2 family competence protein [Patescibacteria group bacterium]